MKNPLNISKKLKPFAIKGGIAVALLYSGVVLFKTCTASALPDGIRSHTVKRSSAKKIIHRRGILVSENKTLIKVQARGTIAEIIKQGTEVKKGDFLFRMDVSDILTDLEREQDNLEQKELALEQAEVKYQQIKFEESLTLNLKKAEYKHALLEQKSELAVPTDNDLRRFETEIRTAQLDLEEAKETFERNKRLYDNTFISLSALEPYERRMKNAEIFLAETKLKVSLKKKGIAEERRIELQKAVQSAKSTVNLAVKRKERILAQLQSNIEVQKRRIAQQKLELQQKQKFVNNASVYAPCNGIFKIRTYWDWSSGGTLREYGPGVKKWPDDIIAEIVNPDDMKIRLAVNQADYPLVKAQAPVILRLPAYPDSVFSGKLKEIGAIGRDRNKIDPTVEGVGAASEVMVFNAEILFENNGLNLHPGMSADIEILCNTANEELLIPRNFVQFDKHKQAYVCIPSAFNFREQPLEGNVFTKDLFLVTEGLKEDDVIILPPEKTTETES